MRRNDDRVYLCEIDELSKVRCRCNKINLRIWGTSQNKIIQVQIFRQAIVSAVAAVSSAAEVPETDHMQQ